MSLNDVEVSILALLASFGPPDLFSTSCHGKSMVTADAQGDALSGMDVSSVCGRPSYREDLEHLGDVETSSAFTLDKFLVFGEPSE